MSARSVRIHELETEWLGRIAFERALAIQERRLAAIRDGSQPEVVYFLEHEPVYTIGRTRDQSSLGQLPALPHPLHRINRGGQATYHGPGQLVGYPLLDLGRRVPDLHAYLRALEDWLIGLLAACGIEAARRDSLTGVWVAGRKIASIGVGVRKWITMHGFALNVGGALDGFAAITPCGIQDVQMTSIERESGRAASVRAVARLAARRAPALAAAVSPQPSTTTAASA